MTRRRTKSIGGNSHGLMRVFINFHHDAQDGFDYSVKRVGDELQENFGGDAAVQEFADANTGDIVWSVRKPLLESVEQHVSFFKGMRTVFENTDDLSPHFTQSQD